MRRRRNMRWTPSSQIAKVEVLATDTHGHSLHAPGKRGKSQMKHCFCGGVVFVFASLMLVSSARAQDQASTAPPTNDAILQHMQALEKEVQDLRAEVTALKSTPVPASATAPVAE